MFVNLSYAAPRAENFWKRDALQVCIWAPLNVLICNAQGIVSEHLLLQITTVKRARQPQLGGVASRELLEDGRTAILRLGAPQCLDL